MCTRSVWAVISWCTEHVLWLWWAYQGTIKHTLRKNKKKRWQALDCAVLTLTGRTEMMLVILTNRPWLGGHLKYRFPLYTPSVFPSMLWGVHRSCDLTWCHNTYMVHLALHLHTHDCLQTRCQLDLHILQSLWPFEAPIHTLGGKNSNSNKLSTFTLTWFFYLNNHTVTDRYLLAHG